MLKKGFTPLEITVQDLSRHNTSKAKSSHYSNSKVSLRKCPSRFLSLTGFTIVELLVVVIIVGILSALALPQYQKMLERSRAAEGVQILGALRKAQEVYYAQYARYESEGSWDDAKSLLIDIPSAKYFQWAPNNGWASVARVMRNSTDNASYGNYCLRMESSGAVSCRDNGSNGCGSVSGVCAKLGYPTF